jgi:hypothetical protein
LEIEDDNYVSAHVCRQRVVYPHRYFTQLPTGCKEFQL